MAEAFLARVNEVRLPAFDRLTAGPSKDEGRLLPERCRYPGIRHRIVDRGRCEKRIIRATSSLLHLMSGRPDRQEQRDARIRTVSVNGRQRWRHESH